MPIANTCSIGYLHDGRADNAAYRHYRRADNAAYRHDRRADSLSRRSLQTASFDVSSKRLANNEAATADQSDCVFSTTTPAHNPRERVMQYIERKKKNKFSVNDQ